MKLATSPHFLSIIVLILLSFFALKSLLTPGFYTSHDGETHTARIAQYFIAIKDGQIPPRFADSFYNGLGSPIFVYIYPSPYFMGAIIHVLGFSFANSFKILMAAGFIVSAIFTYLWLFAVFKNPKAAFLGALFYSWVPYRFSLIYVRGSISEHLAYTFLPLALFALTKLGTTKRNIWIPVAAISISLVLLSQDLVAAISIPVIYMFVLIISLLNKSFKYLFLSTTAFLWGGFMASITYLPALFERKFVRFDAIIQIAYPDHFVSLKQLIRSPWGYGFDLPGTINDSMSFQIGLAHIAVFLLAVLIIIYFFTKKITLIKKIGRVFFNDIDTNSLVLAIFFVAVFIIAAFLTLDIKPVRSIWENVKLLHTIDIPWRLLGLCSVATAFLAAFVSRFVKSGLLFVLLIAAVLIANRNFLRINQAVLFNDNHFLTYTGTATQYNEFTPIWRQTTRVPIGIDPSAKVKVTSGSVDIYNLSSNSKGVSFDANILSQTAQVRINKFYFPLTQMKVDGQSLKLSSGFDISSPTNLNLDREEDSSGMPLLELPQGRHHVVSLYSETPLRLFADMLSLISILTAFVFILRYAKK